MNEAEVWRRVEALEKTRETEALRFLQRFLEEARSRRTPPDEALADGAVLVMSAVGRVDQREVERETLLSELHSEGRWSPELVDLLRRLLDSARPDRGRPLTSLPVLRFHLTR